MSTVQHVVPGPPRVRAGRLAGASATLLSAGTGTTIALDGGPEELLYVVSGTVMLVFAAVFCLRAVTVAGFAAGLGAAGMVLLQPSWLLPLLGGAVLLAVACGFSPGWTRVEAWQAQRGTPLTAVEEAGAGQAQAGGSWRGGHWRSDRVMAALLVLVYPPLATAGAVWFLTWTASR